MRILCVLFAFALMAARPVGAETRVFIVANHADAYGIDRCLATGAACGAAAAAAYCETRQFTKAASYRKVERDEITGAVPNADPQCRGTGCAEFVAIECAR